MLFLKFDPQFLGGERSKSIVAHRSLPKSVAERRKLAWRLGAVVHPNPEQKAVLTALGRDATPALLFFCHHATEERLDELSACLARCAAPEQTREIWSLTHRIRASQRSNEFIGSQAWWNLERWLRQTGDPSFLARVYFSRFKKAKDISEWSILMPYLRRCRDPYVVDEFVRLLKDERTDPFLREEIFGFIADTARPDVLDWIRHTRPTARKRSTANSELSTDRDTDGDGISDAIDINPYAAPRRLGEEERVMQAAFESQVRFHQRSGSLVAITYPPGYRPFELLGIDGTLVPASRLTNDEITVKGEYGNYRYWQVSLFLKDSASEVDFTSHRKIHLRSGATKVTVFFSAVAAPLGGAGYEIALRKIRGEWYVVRVSQQWIS